MKIAHIVCTYPPYYAGMGNVVFQTASELTKLGHEVEVLTPDYYPAEEIKSRTERPAEVHEEKIQEKIDYATRLKPALRYGNAAYIPQIQNELDRFDLVHLHYPFFGVANLVRKWKKRNSRKPLVITYHMDTRAPGWKGLFFKYYAKFWMPKILRSADKLIASSFDYLETSDAGFLYKENPDKWTELPFGVDLEKFKPREKPEELLKHHQLSSDLPIVLFVGGMDAAHYFKGAPVLLSALRFLKDNNTPIQCVFVGEGELREDFEAQAKFSGLDKFARFVGKITDEELPYYYNLADLFVLPSINQGEAFGMVLLEAMASGVPVVATDLPGVRTVAQDAGMIVKPNDPGELAAAISGFFSDKDAASDWQARARQVAEEKYDWGMIVSRLSDVYEGLVRKSLV
ncbi:MAG: hypothetical protein A2921_04535 [Candidatus Magasanikbacteria bacterium RIFCSPLOWO2_01_FULL_43_20b]|uniref:Glycosyltransferase subfamily 4-like N-terminal domain-containing protein n=1 Tax=Candidatus Magasanikbacteria bacterium RIFCSPLOWO2_12_FULL_43_12 TaxID=1798692 RepID=A0A1F6MR88_9BACT|nr:MAG: hypothetical protein A3C74_02620 [Candidatus Magasanikbacteria bacterium RIFCSPHIGHO2_02_FULL_44_13]OGH72597.1 MAG: hypothetical protein A3I93_01545 [Candidatus Magasanikbacteria bacterium RIFCSPLOWO2_02_FULL_43_22]OGH73335.1 MAG: hypothetical protein A2921_04535 [Candidatus Magasanikbacteria bacterium RIFCSPLOWO2_01_FULL_43_20b]OGH74152.1 MAG: hypothetical protein A3G00_02910 [Candidatus Magasanikbacteria bacterium RIFCSPLOWO2_12_FULL_43_12]